MRPALITRLLAMVLCASLVVAETPAPTVPLPKPTGFNAFSPQDDIQAGQQAIAQVRQKMRVMPDSSPVTQYVQHLGQRLVATMPQPTWPYQFHVIDDKQINAFALPGGPVFINLGSVRAAQNEAQLAGVIAHEMAHVYERHSTKQASKQAMAQLPLGVLGAILGQGIGGQLATLGLSFGFGSIFLKYSRDMEAQADAVGARIMYNAGYDPVQLASFFRVIEEQVGNGGSQFFSDHPNPGNRYEAISQEVSQFPHKNFITNTPQFAQVHQDVLAYAGGGSGNQSASRDRGDGGDKGETGDNDRGAEESDRGRDSRDRGDSEPVLTSSPQQPSNSYKTLNHSAFSIQYPENWQVMGDPNSAVTIAPQRGVTNGTVAYGLIINDYQPETANNVDAATHELVSVLRESNPDLKPVGNDQDIRVNGVGGKSVDLIGKSPIQDSSGQLIRERDWLVALPRQDGNVLYMVFISPDNDFSRMRPTFEKMLRSLHLD